MANVEMETYRYPDDLSPVGSVTTLEYPKAWGEGYIIAQALRILARRYYQIFDKKWKED